MLPCHHKIRFETQAFAEFHIANLRTSRVEHHAHAKRLNSYHCAAHGCWHVGHDRPYASRGVRYDYRAHAAEALIHRLRQRLLVEHGRTASEDTWFAIRVLSRVLGHLKG